MGLSLKIVCVVLEIYPDFSQWPIRMSLFSRPGFPLLAKWHHSRGDTQTSVWGIRLGFQSEIDAALLEKHLQRIWAKFRWPHKFSLPSICPHLFNPQWSYLPLFQNYPVWPKYYFYAHDNPSLETWHACNPADCPSQSGPKAPKNKKHKGNTRERSPVKNLMEEEGCGWQPPPSRSEGRMKVSMFRSGFQPIQHKEMFF